MDAEVGLLLPAGTGWGAALEWGRRAEAAGASRMWMADGRAAVVVLGGLFRRLGLRLGPVLRPGRPPATLLAKQLTSLDVVSGGRLDVAVEGSPGAEDVLTVLARLAGGQPYHSDGPIPVAGARCLPPALQRPTFPLWTAVGATTTPGDTDTDTATDAADGGAPAALPAGWREAGLGVVAVTPWSPR